MLSQNWRFIDDTNEAFTMPVPIGKHLQHGSPSISKAKFNGSRGTAFHKLQKGCPPSEVHPNP